MRSSVFQAGPVLPDPGLLYNPAKYRLLIIICFFFRSFVKEQDWGYEYKPKNNQDPTAYAVGSWSSTFLNASIFKSLHPALIPSVTLDRS